MKSEAHRQELKRARRKAKEPFRLKGIFRAGIKASLKRIEATRPKMRIMTVKPAESPPLADEPEFKRIDATVKAGSSMGNAGTVKKAAKKVAKKTAKKATN